MMTGLGTVVAAPTRTRHGGVCELTEGLADEPVGRRGAVGARGCGSHGATAPGWTATLASGAFFRPS